MHNMTRSMINYCEAKGMKYTPECERCGQPLDPETLTWLELDNSSGEWMEPGEVPEGRSQGCFEFGQKCAKLAVKTQRPTQPGLASRP